MIKLRTWSKPTTQKLVGLNAEKTMNWFQYILVYMQIFFMVAFGMASLISHEVWFSLCTGRIRVWEWFQRMLMSLLFDFFHSVAFFFMLWTLPFYNLLTLPLQALAWWTYFFWYIFQLKSTKQFKRQLKTLHIKVYDNLLCIFPCYQLHDQWKRILSSFSNLFLQTNLLSKF